MESLTISIISFNPTTASNELLERYIDFNLKRQKEKEPNDPLSDREVTKKYLLDPNPMSEEFRWLAINNSNQEVCGESLVAWTNEIDPAYEQNKHTAWFSIYVLKDLRKNGIGKRLITKVVEKLSTTKKTTIMAGTSEQDGLEYINSLTFGIKAMEDSSNRLQIQYIDWVEMQKWVDNVSKKAQDVKLLSFTAVPEDHLENYCKFFTTVLNTVPKGELEWEAKITPETRRKDELRHSDKGTIWLTFTTKEPNGDFSGMTEIFYNKANNHVAYQGLTAVHPKYRGRGLGKWLKAQMVIYIKENLPKVKYISTGNADTNEAMLAINRRMGFKHHKSYVEYKFKSEDLYNKFLVK